MNNSLPASVALADQNDAPDSVVRTHWYSMRDDRTDAFALRHRGYVDAGLIEPLPSGVYHDDYDFYPSTLVAALYRRGACTATLRLSFWSPGAAEPALPCEKVYPEVADLKARTQGSIAEISRLSIDPTIDNTRYRTRLYAATIRAGILACFALDAAYLLVATQLKWQSVYQYVMGFRPLGPPQYYPPGDVPVVLLGREIDRELRERIRKNVFFKYEPSELSGLATELPSLLKTK